jgi:acyl-CoA thioester hydrolase
MKPVLPKLEVVTRTQAEFYDLDPMNIVWHGNHARFLEVGRRALLARIDYGYDAMKASGFSWPVVDLHIHYIRPITLGLPIDVVTTIAEWENRLKLAFVLRNADTQERLARASTIQVAVDLRTETMLWETPLVLREKLAPFLPPR